MSDILDVLARDLEPTLLRIFFVIFGGKDNILSQFCIVKDWERILALQECVIYQNPSGLFVLRECTA